MYIFILAHALYRHLEWRDHGVPWPHTDIPLTALPYYMVKRINEASVSNINPDSLAHPMAPILTHSLTHSLTFSTYQ